MKIRIEFQVTGQHLDEQEYGAPLKYDKVELMNTVKELLDILPHYDSCRDFEAKFGTSSISLTKETNNGNRSSTHS